MSLLQGGVASKELKWVRIPQALLNLEGKTRSNLFPWRGQFSPQLVEVLLKSYGPTNGLVVDPFVGSGTVLVEAARLGLQGFGAEINPAAALMANTYQFVQFSKSRRLKLIAAIDQRLAEYSHGALPLFSMSGDRVGNESTCLQRLRVDFANNPDASKLIEALIVTADFGNKDCKMERVLAAWRSLRTCVIDLPHADSPVEMHLADARCLPLTDAAADIVITSPPYINVFNYHQQYRPSVEFLGWDVLAAARSEIGANRKHRQNRFLTVIQYCIDMVDALKEMMRVTKSGVPIILVVGRESNVRKTSFFNGEIVARIATECLGLELPLRQERFFTNKFGQKIFEDILCFPCA